MLARRAVSLLAVLAAIGLAASTPAVDTYTTTTTVETFDAGNEGGWTFGTGNETIQPDGGNPGAYLRDSTLVTFTPRASTSFGVASAFTGDYAARGVTSVGIDLAVASASGNYTGRTLTLILLNDNGTPDDLSDDWGAYTVTPLDLPPSGVIGFVDLLQWRSYDVSVPVTSRTLPPRWKWISRNTLRPNGSWGRLMRDVDHVGFEFGDPELRYPLFEWDVAMDNPRITTSN
ncbi:MAG TPA: hypothetical protein VFV75_06910 [Candidatus Polarisedimenticolaceae bacterium]|nr:hypothetical protein [Candidatus Polarisedimenticolaceae bacterium]